MCWHLRSTCLKCHISYLCVYFVSGTFPTALTATDNYFLEQLEKGEFFKMYFFFTLQDILCKIAYKS